jgi:tetratricopeptide (TPR) repeat protein
LFELPNLLTLLDWIQDKASPELVIDLAGKVEQLVARLDRPRILAQAIRAREKAVRALRNWSHAQFQTERLRSERLLDSGDLQGAYSAAQQLLQHCVNGGISAYPEAEYDIALAHFILGRILCAGGGAEAALHVLAEAQHRFQALADVGNVSAVGMASKSFTEIGTALFFLGRLEEAAAAYEEGIKRDEQRGDKRAIAVNKAQLGAVRTEQRRYEEALKIYAEARDLFANLGDRGLVATSWHHIGIVQRLAGQFEQAEKAYQQSLAIWVLQKNSTNEASSLDELGLLYRYMARLEESVVFHRQAAEIRFRLQDPFAEGRSRNNLAIALIRLQRYVEARRELLRAIECKRSYGHAAQLWKTWSNLYELEIATCNSEAATEARQQAIQSYLSYRRDGGESQSTGAQWCAVTYQAIQQGQVDNALEQLPQLLTSDSPNWARALIPKLQAILGGARDPALADDLALEYDDAAEVLLLLERLHAEEAA